MWTEVYRISFGVRYKNAPETGRNAQLAAMGIRSNVAPFSPPTTPTYLVR